MSGRKQGRIKRVRKPRGKSDRSPEDGQGGGASPSRSKRTKKPRSGRTQRKRSGGTHPYGGPPRYDSLDQVPFDLRVRAELEKLPWIRAYVESGYPRGEMMDLARARARLENLSEDQVPPRSTLHHWVKRYQKWGKLGLVDSVRADAGVVRSITPEAQDLIQTFIRAKGRQSPTSVIRAVVNHLGPDHAPSRDATRHFIDRFILRNPDIAKVAAHGINKFRATNEISMTVDLGFGGVRLAIDSTVADIWIRVPCPTYTTKWRAVRPALTLVQCEGSRSLFTFGLSLVAVNSHLMLALFRRAIMHEANWPGLICSPIPTEVVTDAGSENRGEFEKGLKGLNVKVHRRRPNRPKGNARVERLIQTVQLECLKHLTGYSKTEKPFDPYAPAESDGKRSVTSLTYDPYRLEVPPEHLLTLRELEAKILGWAIHYNTRPHPALSLQKPDVREVISKAEIERATRRNADHKNAA